MDTDELANRLRFLVPADSSADRMVWCAAEKASYSMNNPKIFYRNRLPHIAPPGAIFFITFRLGDSLPRHIIQGLKDDLELATGDLERNQPKNWKEEVYNLRKLYFGKFDAQLDKKPYGNCYLKQPGIAKIVIGQLERFDNEWYELQAYCIMPNHVHLLIDTSIQFENQNHTNQYVQLDAILHRIKGASARYANLALGRPGAFWQKDSYDHIVRDQKEWERIVAYIKNNPVKAGLVSDWLEWPFTYMRYE